jgi:transposase-like protein
MPPVAPEFRMALLELLRQYQEDEALDVLREGVRLLAEALMELEVSEQVGAGRYERSPERRTYRNGYRERAWDTRVGRIPCGSPSCGRAATSPARYPLERLNRELARRSDVAGILPNPQAVLRLLGALLEQIPVQRMVSRRYFSSTLHAQAAPGGRTRCGPGCSPRGVSPGRL